MVECGLQPGAERRRGAFGAVLPPPCLSGSRAGGPSAGGGPTRPDRREPPGPGAA